MTSGNLSDGDGFVSPVVDSSTTAKRHDTSHRTPTDDDIKKTDLKGTPSPHKRRTSNYSLGPYNKEDEQRRKLGEIVECKFVSGILAITFAIDICCAFSHLSLPSKSL